MQLRSLVLAGIMTWFIVALPHAGEITPVWALCSVAFLALFILATRERCAPRDELIYAALQTLLALVCTWLKPHGMQPVLLVLVATHCATFASATPCSGSPCRRPACTS